MRLFLPTSLAFIISSLVVLVCLYYKVPVKNLQQVILAIIIILFLLNRFLKSPRYAFIFLTALAVQLIVLSSGGVGSPVMILIHLYTLGISFILGLIPSFVFLFCSVLVLVAQIIFDENLRKIVLEDLGTLALYGTSFLVVVPLSIFVGKLYFLKDKLLEVVKKELSQQKIQNQVLLKGTSDVIFITDTDLKIISCNEAAEIELALPQSAIIQKSLFDLLYIREGNGNLVSAHSLSVDRIIEEKNTRIIKSLQLLVKNRITPKTVDLQIRPILNLEGHVEQLMIIVGDGGRSRDSSHPILEGARLRKDSIGRDLKSLLLAHGSPQIILSSELIGRVWQDISLLAEIEDHSIKPNPTLVDTASICLKSVSGTKDFASIIGVNLESSFVNFENKDLSSIIPSGFNISRDILTAPYFTLPVDMKWFDILIHKLLLVGIFLVAGMQNPKVLLSIEKQEDFLLVRIQTSQTALKHGEENLLFTEYYGDLYTRTNLRLGSGLEGYLAKKIADSLDMPLDVFLNNGQLLLSLKMSKKLQATIDR